MGSITETATSAPGNSSLRPNTKAPLAKTLKLNGYSTAQFGKCHEVPVGSPSPMGPFDAWPSGGGGFETFYGFIGGENNQWDPAAVRRHHPVEPPATPEEGYTLNEELADPRGAWLRQAKALMPDRPFFMYLRLRGYPCPAPRAARSGPKVTGVFDEGWDAQRERTLQRQTDSVSSRPDTELTGGPRKIEGLPDGTRCTTNSSRC